MQSTKDYSKMYFYIVFLYLTHLPISAYVANIQTQIM